MITLGREARSDRGCRFSAKERRLWRIKWRMLGRPRTRICCGLKRSVWRVGGLAGAATENAAIHPMSTASKVVRSLRLAYDAECGFRVWTRCLRMSSGVAVGILDIESPAPGLCEWGAMTEVLRGRFMRATQRAVSVYARAGIRSPVLEGGRE